MGSLEAGKLTPGGNLLVDCVPDLLFDCFLVIIYNFELGTIALAGYPNFCVSFEHPLISYFSLNTN